MPRYINLILKMERKEPKVTIDLNIIHLFDKPINKAINEQITL